MRAIRVLYVSTSGELGGAERSLLSDATSRDPLAVHAVAALPSSGPFAKALEHAGVTVHIVPTLRRLRRRGKIADHIVQVGSLVRGSAACARIAAKERVDIVHANTTSACLYSALAPVHRRRMLIWHLRDFDATPGLARLLMVAGAHVVTPSRAIARQLGAAYQSRVSVIANGVALADETQARSSASATHTVLAIGQLVPWKNHDRVVQVAEIVASRAQKPVIFQIVGGPPPGESNRSLLQLRDEIRRRRLDSIVKVLGPRADIANLLASADLLLHLAYPEPFGRVVVEAMLMAVPVVALAGDHGPAEIIEHDVTGILLNDHTAEAAAVCVLDLLESLGTLRRLGLAGQKRAQTEYSPLRAARQLQILYQRLVGTHASTLS